MYLRAVIALCRTPISAESAARTAFSFPCGKATASARRFGCLSSGTKSFLRRDRSSSAAETNLSSSSSSRCRIAASRSLGKTCRDGSAVSVSRLVARDDDSEGDDGEGSRPDDDDVSGIEDRFGCGIMRQVCRRFRWTHNHKGASRSNMHMLSTGLAGGRVLRRPRYHFRIRICTSLKRKRRQRLRLPPF